MKRRSFWKAFFLCFALALGLLVLGRPGKVQAEEPNSPVYYVYINGYYLGEGDGAQGLYYVGTSDTTGYVTSDPSSNWTARYVPSSGRLDLRNYRGGKIVCLPAHTMQNFDIKLEGNSFITETSSNDSYGVGLQISSANVRTVITSAEQEHGTLTINVYNSAVPCYGINCCASGTSSEGVYVQGTANVMITAAGKCGFGIWSGGTVGVFERASVNITAKYNQNASSSFSAAVYSQTGNLDISTSGSVSIESVARDNYKHSGYGFAFYGEAGSACLNCSPKDFPYVSLSAVGYHAKVSNRTSVLERDYYNLEKTVKQTGVTESLLLEYSTGQTYVIGAHFPDPSFRLLVSDTIDTNHDNKLSSTEISAVQQIYIINEANYSRYYDAYSLMGIELFTNLTDLTWDTDYFDTDVTSGNLLEVDLRNNTKLKNVVIRGTRMRELYVSNLSSLRWLELSKNTLHGPDLTGLTALKTLMLRDNLLADIDLSPVKNLEYLDVAENYLETLDVSAHTKLDYLYCEDNELTSLDVSKLTVLRSLTCGGNPFETLSLTKNTALEWLSCNNSCLSSLNVSKNTALHALDCSHSDSLKTLTLGTNSNLMRLRCFDSVNLNAVNVSGCSQLKNVIASGDRKTVTEDGYTFRQYAIYDETGYASRCIDADRETVLVYQKPSTAYSSANATKIFTADAACGTTMTFRWQYRTSSSGTWKNCSSAMQGYDTNTLKVPAKTYRNGYQYRCKFINANGKAGYSPAATLYVLSIRTQPSDVSTTVGKTVNFKVAAAGGGLKYQWRWRTPGGSWKNCTGTGSQTATLPIEALERRNGYEYQCKVTDGGGNSLTTRAVQLSVLKTQPVSASVKEGATASFSAAGCGSGLKYQWQYRTSSSGNWLNCTSATTGYNKPTLKVVGKTYRHGYQYRCLITDSAGLTVHSVAVTLNVLGIKTQPKSVGAAAGNTVSFKVVAVGKGLTYQWQYRTSPSGTWRNCTSSTEGYNKATLKVEAKTYRNGYQYRCVVGDSAGNSVNSQAATLTVN